MMKTQYQNIQTCQFDKMMMSDSSKTTVMEGRFNRVLSTIDGGQDWRELKNPCYGEIEEIEDEAEKRFKLFHNFHVVSDPPSDHRFIIANNRKLSHQTDNDWDHIIRREWEILENCLPASIYVIVYRRRTDLMRAVIIGPEGTPYCHGLFFFDVSLPCKYPAQPPEICYLSDGLEIKPYLHGNGKVSLDLLNSGFWNRLSLQNKQKWNPGKSNILEVLISIQSSVLKGNSYPYTPLPRILYDKDTFMMLCESMLHALHTPPMDFEVFVAGHFRRQAHPILMICKANMDTSVPKDPIHQLFQHLIEAFEENGAYCQHHCAPSKHVESLKTNSRQNQAFEAIVTDDKQASNGRLERNTQRTKLPWQLLNFRQLLFCL